MLKVGLGDGEEATSKRRGSGETEGKACASSGGKGGAEPSLERGGLTADASRTPSLLLSSRLGYEATTSFT